MEHLVDEGDQAQHRMTTFLSLEREISRITAAEEGNVSIPAYLPMPNRHGRSTGEADADGSGPHAAEADAGAAPAATEGGSSAAHDEADAPAAEPICSICMVLGHSFPSFFAALRHICASAQPNSSTTYRADVDGLRAVAVIAVVLFHLDVSYAPGGFVGVDVFFTISGYVVAKSLLARPPFGSVRSFLLAFYSRRVKRLAPALCLCVIATSLAVAILVEPASPRNGIFYASGAIALLGGANIYFACCASIPAEGHDEPSGGDSSGSGGHDAIYTAAPNATNASSAAAAANLSSGSARDQTPEWPRLPPGPSLPPISPPIDAAAYFGQQQGRRLGGALGAEDGPLQLQNPFLHAWSLGVEEVPRAMSNGGAASPVHQRPISSEPCIAPDRQTPHSSTHNGLPKPHSRVLARAAILPPLPAAAHPLLRQKARRSSRPREGEQHAATWTLRLPRFATRMPPAASIAPPHRCPRRHLRCLVCRLLGAELVPSRPRLLPPAQPLLGARGRRAPLRLRNIRRARRLRPPVAPAPTR